MFELPATAARLPPRELDGQDAHDALGGAALRCSFLTAEYIGPAQAASVWQPCARRHDGSNPVQVGGDASEPISGMLEAAGALSRAGYVKPLRGQAIADFIANRTPVTHIATIRRIEMNGPAMMVDGACIRSPCTACRRDPRHCLDDDLAMVRGATGGAALRFRCPHLDLTLDLEPADGVVWFLADLKAAPGGVDVAHGRTLNLASALAHAADALDEQGYFPALDRDQLTLFLHRAYGDGGA